MAQDLIYSLTEEISVINKAYCGYYVIGTNYESGMKN